ncbi:peptidoglycan editing factor PgeF [Synechococcus sp. BSF8S]|uniref:peptidoglycan editing factor PgeF n=1 Tax=Synechococcales TaxID=1890424 RepID=UPI001629FB51|nr:peptidoglycan editing factor PgeF [Synechococcus sp. BSF8S]MBC1263606.1 peptidoglycan editing factor PgeF [Synechococcus sp. BSA11S]
MAEAVDPPFDRPDVGFNALDGWTWVGTYGGYVLQCDLLGEFEHGFFTRQWSGRGPQELAAAITAGVSVHRTRQIHSSLVLPASEAAAEPWPEGDGLVSDGGGQSLWVCGADCTPVLIADRARGSVAACHAGWRGVASRILPAAIEALERSGSRRSDLVLALGPAVRGEAYQVKQDVALQVASACCAPGEDPLQSLMAAGGLTPESSLEFPGDRCRLDIRKAARSQLLNAGLEAEQLRLCPLCTVGEPLMFHSWRRDQVKAVQWSGIVAQA